MEATFLLAFTASDECNTVEDFASFIGQDEVIGLIGKYFGWEPGGNVSLYIERWTSQDDGADAFALFLRVPNSDQGVLFEGDEDVNPL